MQFDLKRLIQPEEGKSFSPHPGLAGFDQASTYQPGAARSESLISQHEAHTHGSVYGGDQAIDWIMDCVRLYSDGTSTADWHLEEKGKQLIRPGEEDGAVKGAKAGPADLYRLLDAPNPFMDYAELVDLLVIDLLLVGNAYWLKWRQTTDGKPLAIYRLAPAYVKIVPGPFGPKSYVYQPPGTKDPLRLTPDQVMHMRLPNPHSAYYGLGIVQGGGPALDLELALTDTSRYYYNNKADPSLIVQSERRVPRDVFNKLRAQMRARVSGPSNAGELLVLEAGLKASSLSTTAADQLLQVMGQYSRNRILAMFRVANVLLGITDQGIPTGDSTAAARREFDTKTMRPFLNRLQRRISAGLTAAWGVDFVIEYLYRMPEEEVVKQGGSLAAIPGIKVREVRRFLAPLGIEESTGDSTIDEMVLNLPGTNLGPDGQPVAGAAGFADRNLPGEPGRPPLGKNTRAFPAGTAARSPKPGGKALTVDEVLARLDILSATAQKEEGKSVRKMAPDERPHDSLLDARDADIDAAVRSMTQEISDAITTLERGLLDHAEGKAFNKDDNLVSRIRKSEAWMVFKTLLTNALAKGTKSAISAAATHASSLGVTPQDDMDYESIAKRVIYRKDGVDAITENLRDSLARAVGTTLNTGGDRAKVDAVIREHLKEWAAGKSETVALTEAVHAYNEGTLTAAEMSGINEVLVRDGRDHDEPCVSADGEVWTIDHARDHRLEHPRCRRAFTPLFAVS